MASFAIEKDRAAAQGDVLVKEGFSGGVRSLESNSFSVDDFIVFPEKMEVFKTKIGDTDRWVEYCFVAVFHGDATPTIKKFYPSTFTKRRTQVNKDGSAYMGDDSIVMNTGTACEQYRSFGKISDAMDSFKGKRIKVTDSKMYWVLRWNSMDEVITTSMINLDLDGDATKEQLKVFK